LESQQPVPSPQGCPGAEQLTVAKSASELASTVGPLTVALSLARSTGGLTVELQPVMPRHAARTSSNTRAFISQAVRRATSLRQSTPGDEAHAQRRRVDPARVARTLPPMRAVTLRSHGGPEVLTVEDLPEPEPQPGEVRIRVEAVAMNHVDLWVRRGLPHLKLGYPFLLGADVSGVVDAVGVGVSGWKAGDAVVVNPGHSCGRCRECLSGRDNYCAKFQLMGEDRPGGYAEKICVPQTNLVARPAGLDPVVAAAAPVTFLTAWQMLCRKAPLEPGMTVLIMAAGSGVGTAALQIAKLRGARVFATASSESKRQRLKAMGADEVLDHKSTDLVARVKELTGKRGVDVVFEHLGGNILNQAVLSATRGGKVVTCGATLGWDARVDLRHVFFRQVEILGSTMASKGELFPILDHIAAQRLTPVVDRVLPLSQAQEAHKLLEDGEIFGKIVLRPNA
jgi:NADPH:quinone reductase-like Zn-dependent oxidoreductase